MKYIDAYKLYKQVDELMVHFAELENETKLSNKDLSIFYQGKKEMCSELLGIIDSLQQEQPEVDWEEEYKTWWKSISGKINVEHIMEWYMHQTAHHFYKLGLNTRKEEII